MITIGRRTLAVFTTCSLLSLVFAPASWPNNVMPKSLVDVARANGCNPIDDFFDRDPNIMNPPYVLGWIPEAPYSAVFWCKKIGKSDRPYKLIFAVGETLELKLCRRKATGGVPSCHRVLESAGRSKNQNTTQSCIEFFLYCCRYTSEARSNWCVNQRSRTCE